MLTDYFARLDAETARREERVLRALERSGTHQTISRSTWRMIMTSRYSRLGAVAAVLAIAAIALVFLNRSTPAYAITDLPTTFDEARVIHVKGRQYFPGHKTTDGAEIPPVETDNWIDVGNQRYRYTGTGLSDDGRGNVTVRVFETVCDGPYTMVANSTNKTVMFMRISDLNREMMTHRMSRLAWGQLCGRPDQLADFVKAGRDAIGGNTYDIWQLDMAHAAAGGGGGASGQPVAAPGASLRFKLWLTADRGRLGRSQMWQRNRDGQWQLQNDYQTVEYDVEPPADTFSLEPPAGYTAANAKETAPLMPLAGGSVSSGANGHVWECGMHVSFALADGSVVMGWRSLDRSAREPQEPLFASLVFGGPLPKLPVELFGLKPAGAANGTIYMGYHLACTRKANQFTEWALYVPDAEPPASVESLGYDVLYRFNLDPKPKWIINLNAEYGVLIGDAADFDKWVRGAMAELSDNGTPPPDVTYQKVVDLARQIRNH